MKLYYGNGVCSIEGNARGVEIRYRGSIEIEDKTNDNFAIAHQNNGIMIFPLGEGFLNELFAYVGEFKILSVIVADVNAEKAPTTIHRVMDYPELLGKPESITTKPEDLNKTHISGRKVNKTILKQPYINNLHTSRHDGDLFTENGDLYNGDYHIHLLDSAVSTGKTQTDASVDLYFKQIIGGVLQDKLFPTRNPSHIPPAVQSRRKTRKRKTRRRY